MPTMDSIAKMMTSHKKDFPILGRTVHDKPIVYLDSGASTQMPTVVIDRLNYYLTQEHSNVHRGVHTLSQEATIVYEGARETVRRFLNAQSSDEIIFTRGTTDAINLMAFSYARYAKLGPSDVILLSAMEHHANIVPWQMVAELTGAQIKVIPMDNLGVLDMGVYQQLLKDNTVKVVGVNLVSNALGTINPVKEMIDWAHQAGAVVMLDVAQAISFMPVDVQALNADFVAFSGHKLFAPTGIGVLYGKKELLNQMPPVQGGGDMIKSVSFEKTVYNDLPYKFEAGTPPIMAAVGLATAIEYVEAIGFEAIQAHELHLLKLATEGLKQLPKVKIIGESPNKAAVLSFVIQHIHPHDIGSILDGEGIAVRAGHHCAEPVMKHFGISGTARATFSIYNDEQDVEAFIKGVQRVIDILG
jgi:cysteine desulfurase / selenocysteine lyase